MRIEASISELLELAVVSVALVVRVGVVYWVLAYELPAVVIVATSTAYRGHAWTRHFLEGRMLIDEAW